ncbi:hypothetical protein BC827DRAFT_165288 [Russula dissimulans]|nr:hypothetical protein BC827DRAFT_165288 [Russula dissimulans]
MVIHMGPCLAIRVSLLSLLLLTRLGQDTAGQERFLSLSSAFSRGADAAVLILDVNQPKTLQALGRWWSDFCTHTPLSDEGCWLVVVGNKTNLVPSSTDCTAISEGAALHFIDELIPPSEPPSSAPATPEIERDPQQRCHARRGHTLGYYSSRRYHSHKQDVLCRYPITRPTTL